ncbi:MAG TPA: GNAT family N-acetyltransferase [Chthoniobacterales bacterium]
MTTPNLTLIPHDPRDLLALLNGTPEYERSSGRRVAHEVREFLLAASPEYIAALKTATAPDPWKFGFAVLHKIDNVVIGMCGFTAPPDANGAVELAYGIVPSYQGKGYATEAAAALVDLATADPRVRIIRAHTLPERNASTRVLEKCRFRKIGEVVDPENNLVWGWERKLAPSQT